MEISKMILLLFKIFLITLHEVRLTKAQDSETFDPIDDILGVFPTDVDTTVVSKTVSVTEEATQTTVPAVEDLVEARGEKYDLAPRDVPDMMVGEYRHFVTNIRDVSWFIYGENNVPYHRRCVKTSEMPLLRF